MSDEAEIFDVSYSSLTEQCVYSLMETYCSGNKSKLAFQEKDGSLPPFVYLTFQVTNGDVYFAFQETFPDGTEAEKEKTPGVLRLWEVEPAITRADLRAALDGIVPTLDAIRKGATVARKNGKQTATLNEEALAADASIGVIGRRA